MSLENLLAIKRLVKHEATPGSILKLLAAADAELGVRMTRLRDNVKERNVNGFTVAGAVKRLRNRGVTFATVHGNQSIMEAAAAAKGDIKILGVTVLTSLDRGDLDDLGFQCDVSELVLSRARRALEAGCDGVVSSGLEAKMLRAEIDQRLLVITPGIRPVDNRPSDDQNRVVTPTQAFDWGADYIVVGRPIRDAADPRAAAEAIQAEIAAAAR